MKNPVVWIVITLVLLAGVGGWWFGRPAPVIEKRAVEVTQADGSKILAKAPDAKAKPKQVVPKQATVERIAQITAQGAPVTTASGEVKDCPPVTVDMTLIREPDGSKRVIASSPDGKILSGVDIPVETAAPPPEPPKWAAGVSLNPLNQTAGVWVERDVMRLRVGLELNQTRSTWGAVPGVEARVRVGWTF